MTPGNCRRGSTSAEFALVLMPFILLVFGTFEFARLAWTRHVLQETAVAAARCMGVRAAACSTAGIVDNAKTRGFARDHAGTFSIALAPSQIVAAQNARCGGETGFNSVLITTHFRTVIPVLEQFIDADAPLTFTACFPSQA